MERRPSPTLIRRSTREFFAEGRRTPGYSLLDWMHGYIYGRWLYTYAGLAIGNHLLARLAEPLILWAARRAQRGKQATDAAKAFADTYHGKVVSLDAAKQLVSVKEDIRLTELEHVIPYARARDIVLEQPDHLAVMECACRATREKACLPLDVCLVIGEPFVGFIVEHHPHRARRITQAEAMDILTAEHERGHVHHAFFKDAMLGRFYAICNCCSCCCGAMQAQRQGVPMLASSGYVAQVDRERCMGCGTCAEACPFDALALSDEVATVQAETCLGCGVCTERCPQEALSLKLDPSRSAPLDLQALLKPRAEASS
jgi:NAD-dependent dihydropyrimidine dehydrogenase PreA subunit